MDPEKILKFTHPAWWLLLFVFPILYLITKTKTLWKSCLSLLRKRKFWISGSYFICLAFLPIVVLNWTVKNPDHIFSRVAVFTYMILMIFMVLVVLLLASQEYFRWLQDWRRWQKWVKIRPSSITAQELLKLMQPYHYSIFCKRLITTVHEQDLLIATEESVDLIKELALVLERSLLSERQRTHRRQKKRRNILIQIIRDIKLSTRIFRLHRIKKKPRSERIVDTFSKSDFLAPWLREYTKKDKKRLIQLGDEFLDEIYILLGQLRAKS